MKLIEELRKELRNAQKQKRLAENELDFAYYKGEVEMIKKVLLILKTLEQGEGQ